MITPAQFDALGPLGREIITHDRETDSDRDALVDRKVWPIGWGAYFRDRRAERTALTRAAARLCSRPGDQ